MEAGTFTYIDLETMLPVFHAGIKNELDDAIDCYNLSKSGRRFSVYSNARILVYSMTIIAKQICLSREASHFAIRITEGNGEYCVSFLFETVTKAPVHGAADISANAPSLGMSREALDYVLQNEKNGGFCVCLTRKGKHSSFDFIFGKSDVEINPMYSQMHSRDFEHLREDFFAALELF